MQHFSPPINKWFDLAKRKVTIKTRAHHIIRLFLVGILSFAFVSACGANVTQKSKSDSSTLPSATGTNTTESLCRTVKHAMGETCVPTNPQRVIVVDEIALDAVLALGVKPIAAGEPGLVGKRARHLAGKLEGIASLGSETQVNLEKMVQLKPELILGFKTAKENYKVFSQIAPTVPLEYKHTAWKNDLKQIGEILNKSQKAEQLLAQYQERLEKLQTALGSRLEKSEVSIVRFTASQNTHFRTQASFPGSVLQDVGLLRPEAQRRVTEPNQPYVTVSLERLDLLDGDVMFAALDPGSEDSFQKFQSSALWQTLKAVKNKQVYAVDSGYWSFGNILAANAILDDLFKYLAQGQR